MATARRRSTAGAKGFGGLWRHAVVVDLGAGTVGRFARDLALISSQSGDPSGWRRRLSAGARRTVTGRRFNGRWRRRPDPWRVPDHPPGGGGGDLPRMAADAPWANYGGPVHRWDNRFEVWVPPGGPACLRALGEDGWRALDAVADRFIAALQAPDASGLPSCDTLMTAG